MQLTTDLYRHLSRAVEAYQQRHRFFYVCGIFPPIGRWAHSKSLPLVTPVQKSASFQLRTGSGFFLILCGLFKKMVIADRMALYVNEVYANPADFNGLVTLVATLFFAIQIYCDFSGYTDIAIGVARTMGFDLMKNFDTPYFSKSITEFWRRWHISLSTWFRDYLFIPLGGSRRTEYRVYLNLFIVSGLWHGSSMNFVVWGALHGLIIVLEKFNRMHDVLSFLPKTSFFRSLKTAYIFSLVCFAWIFFRSDTFAKSLSIIDNIFNITLNDFGSSIVHNGMDIYDTYVAFLVLVLLFAIECFQQKYDLYGLLRRRNIVLRWSFYTLTIVLIAVFGIYGDYDESQFIYFQF